MNTFAAELSYLRALTFRLSSTPTSQLPQQVPAIVSSLANCRSLLSTTQAAISKSGSDASVAVHKFRTILSALLQDRTIQGRWCAIVLVKSAVEIGGWETLHKCLPWVRGLLGILTKPDPQSSKRLCLITLTRIFILTRGYPTLVREITTPSLPTFIQSCLQLAASTTSTDLLQTLLESFNQLLPKHPTVFRSYIKQLQQLLGQTMAPTPSSRLAEGQTRKLKVEVSAEIADAARRLHVQLPCSAPKGGSKEEWEENFKVTVENAHRIAGKVFRAVIEDWQSNFGASSTPTGRTLEGEIQDSEIDSMLLPPWSGIYAGGERLIALLRIIKDYLANVTPTAVSTPVGITVDLLARIFSLTVPSSSNSKSFSNTVRFNNQVSKEERENLWAVLPEVHVAAVEVLLTLTSRCGENVIALDSVILDQLVWLFGAEKGNILVRTACYAAISQILARSGPTLPKPSIESLAGVIRNCCEDVLPQDQNTMAKSSATQNKQNGNSQAQTGTTNADTFLSSAPTWKDPLANFAGLKHTASDLLPVLLTSIPPQHLSDSLRTRMDRTAILSRHKEAMLASIMNPPPSKKFGKPATSILPLMARSFPDAKDVEALLRPRMPVIRITNLEADEDWDEDDDEEDETEDIEPLVAEENDPFVDERLDNLSGIAKRANLSPGDAVMKGASDSDLSRPALEPALQPPAILADVEMTETSEQVPSHKTPMSGKRPPNRASPLSPSKRLRVDVPEAVTSESIPHVETPTIVPPQPGVVSTTSAPATAPEESDDDDYGELVLGQDTEDEEEE